MPPTLRKCCLLSCGSLQTLIRARLRVSPRIERRLMPRTCFPHCGLMRCRSSGRFNAPMQHLFINIIHITPWAACGGAVGGAERTLRSGGGLYLYGPYQINGRRTTICNQEFDAWLRTHNAEWGVRDIAEVTKLAQRHRFSLAETVSMPANNLSVIFERDA